MDITEQKGTKWRHQWLIEGKLVEISASLEHSSQNFSLDTLNRRPEFKVWGWRFAFLLKWNFSAQVWILHRFAIYLNVITGTISAICCYLNGFLFVICWPVGLSVHCGSKYISKELTPGAFAFPLDGQMICSSLLNYTIFHMKCAWQSMAVLKYQNFFISSLWCASCCVLQ
jgi:hypothetical protein